MCGLFPSDEREPKLDRIGDPLAALDATVVLAETAREVSALLKVVNYSQRGRPPFSVLLVVKQLVLNSCTSHRTIGLSSKRSIELRSSAFWA